MPTNGRPPLRANTAEDFARVLRRTSARYYANAIPRATFDAAMKRLWDRVDAAGLRRAVMRLVDQEGF